MYYRMRGKKGPILNWAFFAMDGISQKYLPTVNTDEMEVEVNEAVIYLVVPDEKKIDTLRKFIISFVWIR